MRVQPLTSLSVLMSLSTPLVVGLMGWDAGSCLLALAYGLVLIEFKKYTGVFQFLMLLLTGTAMGMLLDHIHLSYPLATGAIFMIAFATMVRQAFMHWFTYVNLLWVEPLLLTVAVMMLVQANALASWPWQLIWLPLLPVLAAVVLVGNYVHDGIIIKRNTRFGYRIQVGHRAPDITLPDQAGNLVSLSDFRGRHPLLLIFVRGDWCPGCHMMLRTYERSREEFQRKGVHVLAIGPDDVEVNRDMVARIGVGYKLLSDREQEASSIYGVVYNNPVLETGIDYAKGIPLPASFLIDADGVVRHVSRPDRVGEFLDPALIFRVLEQLQERSESPAWT